MKDNSCAKAVAGDSISVQNAELDQDERIVLEMMRHLFQSFAQPASQGWLNAFYVGMDHFPEDNAANITLATLAVVQNMRTSRREVFRFSNPNCRTCSKILSEDERQLIGVVAATRRGARSCAHAHALMLCEGNDTAPMLQAAVQLSHLLARSMQPA